MNECLESEYIEAIGYCLMICQTGVLFICVDRYTCGIIIGCLRITPVRLVVFLLVGFQISQNISPTIRSELELVITSNTQPFL